MKPLHVMLLALLVAIATACNTCPLPTGILVGEPVAISTLLGGSVLACPSAGTCVLTDAISVGGLLGIVGGLLGEVLGTVEIVLDDVLTTVMDAFTVVEGLAAGPASIPCISLSAVADPALFLAVDAAGLVSLTAEVAGIEAAIAATFCLPAGSTSLGAILTACGQDTSITTLSGGLAGCAATAE
jgi:hypothetical protein